MLDVHAIKAQDLTALSAADLAELATRMLAHIGEQSLHIDALDKRVDSQARGIKWRDAKIENITFQLARLKALVGVNYPVRRIDSPVLLPLVTRCLT